MKTIYTVCSPDPDLQEEAFEALKKHRDLKSFPFIEAPVFHFPENKILCFAQGYHETFKVVERVKSLEDSVFIANGFMSDVFAAITALDFKNGSIPPVAPDFFVFRNQVIQEVRVVYLYLKAKSGEVGRRTALIELYSCRDTRGIDEKWLPFERLNAEELSGLIRQDKK